MFFEPFKEEEITPDEGETFSSSMLSCFNNFFCHFPLGNEPYETDELVATIGRYRKQSKLNNREDSSHKTDKYPKLLGIGEEEPVPVTRKEFYDDLYQTVEDCGMKMEDVSKTLNLLTHMNLLNEDDYEKIFKTLGPIFKGMRNKGYSNSALWC